jgi:hypothetical protein
MKNGRGRSDCAGITTFLRIILHPCLLSVFDGKIFILYLNGGLALIRAIKYVSTIQTI